jgi:hypothetical protein
MSTADSSRELGNRGHPMAAMLDHTHVARLARQSNKDATPPHCAFIGKATPRLEDILHYYYPDVPLAHAEWREPKKATSRSPALSATTLPIAFKS